MAEFHSFFGFAPTLRFGIRPEDSESEDTTNDINVLFPDGSCQLTLPKTFYALYYNMLLFYANGGGPCYIVSVGDYEHDFKSIDFTNALLAIKKRTGAHVGRRSGSRIYGGRRLLQSSNCRFDALW